MTQNTKYATFENVFILMWQKNSTDFFYFVLILTNLSVEILRKFDLNGVNGDCKCNPKRHIYYICKGSKTVPF